MKRSFETSPEDVKETDSDKVGTEVFDEGTEVVPRDGVMAARIGEISGSITQRDVEVPKMHIVQGVGPLSEKFDSAKGGLVLKKEHVIYTMGDEPLEVVVMQLDKFYEDWVPYNPDGPIPNKYDTLAQVHAAGLWADWRPGKSGKDEKPPVREVADILVAISKPAKIECPCFSHTLGDTQVALAKWTVRGSAYTRAAKRIITAAAVELSKRGLLAGRWSLGTAREKIGAYLVYVPVMSLKAGFNDEERVAEIRGLMG